MYRIMLVDDEIVSQNIVQQYIATRLPGYQISAVLNNGWEALQAFCNSPADIMLVDIRMPVMDGLTLIEKLNEISSDYVPIIISSYGEFEYAKTAMKLGVAHYLLKPLDFKELTHALEAAAKTLEFKRIAYTSLTWQDDNQELYLTDVLKGKYPDRALAQADFSELDFPFSYDSCNGLYIRIDFMNTDVWMYGRDALLTAMTNLINLLYSPSYVLPVFRKQNCCNYLLIDPNRNPESFDELCAQVRQILKITIRIQLLFSFDSAENLRSISSGRQNRELTADMKSEEDLSDTDKTAIRASIEKAIAYMKEHYAQDLTRDSVAERIYMSGAHFSRCFKMVTNISYKDYLTEIRMQKAMELLKTNIRVADIAERVGYPNPNRFNINFRQYTSYTPSEYRTYVLKMI